MCGRLVIRNTEVVLRARQPLRSSLHSDHQPFENLYSGQSEDFRSIFINRPGYSDGGRSLSGYTASVSELPVHGSILRRHVSSYRTARGRM